MIEFQVEVLTQGADEESTATVKAVLTADDEGIELEVEANTRGEDEVIVLRNRNIL